MSSDNSTSRRKFTKLVSTLTVGALAGCTSSEQSPSTRTSTTTDTTHSETTTDTQDSTTESTDIVAALQREATPIELTASSANLDSVAADLAETPILGLGENSHGVAEFKTIPFQLVQRLVSDHGYRLLAMEGTLGDFAPVNAYITGGDTDIDTALSSLEFYFWRTDGIRQMFKWLREFNATQSEEDQVVVHGYDAQFHDINAKAIRSYLTAVDPDYRDRIDDSLATLTEPLYEQSDAEFMTDEQVALVERLRERLRTHKTEYISRSSESEWQLARRHVWTLERGLQFLKAAAAEKYTQGKKIRDRAMAENVAWLRDWTGAERTIVMGNSNHTMRGYGDAARQGARMGQHLTEMFGEDYYSLGMLFGTGSFSVPSHQHGAGFTTHEISGPVEDTLEETLIESDDSRFFLDFADARDEPVIDDWLADISKVQFTVPRAAKRGAVGLPAPPGQVYDGVIFVEEASPASSVASTKQ